MVVNLIGQIQLPLNRRFDRSNTSNRFNLFNIYNIWKYLILLWVQYLMHQYQELFIILLLESTNISYSHVVISSQDRLKIYQSVMTMWAQVPLEVLLFLQLSWYQSTRFLILESWVQIPMGTLNTHLAQLVRALILVYPLCLIHSRKGNRLHVGSIPSTSTILEYLSGLRAQTANLMIRGFKSHLQVYVLYR